MRTIPPFMWPENPPANRLQSDSNFGTVSGVENELATNDSPDSLSE